MDEEAAQELLARSLQALVLEALQGVVPRGVAHAVLGVPKEAVRPTSVPGGSDFQCHAPVAAHRRLHAMAARRPPAAAAAPAPASDAPTAADDADVPPPWLNAEGHLVLTTVSEYGIRREAVYPDPASLAMAVSESLPTVRLPLNDSTLAQRPPWVWVFDTCETHRSRDGGRGAEMGGGESRTWLSSMRRQAGGWVPRRWWT